MSDTPRTDAETVTLSPNEIYSEKQREIVDSDFARQLERELAEAKLFLANRELSLKQQGDDWVKAMTDRDQWRSCAEELAKATNDLLNDGVVYPDLEGNPITHEANPVRAVDALFRFKQLKGQK